MTDVILREMHITKNKQTLNSFHVLVCPLQEEKKLRSSLNSPEIDGHFIAAQLEDSISNRIHRHSEVSPFRDEVSIDDVCVVRQ